MLIFGMHSNWSHRYESPSADRSIAPDNKHASVYIRYDNSGITALFDRRIQNVVSTLDRFSIVRHRAAEMRRCVCVARRHQITSYGINHATADTWPFTALCNMLFESNNYFSKGLSPVQSLRGGFLHPCPFVFCLSFSCLPPLF